MSRVPFKDPEKKRAADRERRGRISSRPPIDQPGSFARWLTTIVTTYPVGRGGAWSDALATAMQRGPEFDAYLRRVADGGIKKPRAESVWEIGEGLRACGLLWVSGALALKQSSRVGLLSVLDIAAVDEPTKAQLSMWLANADVLDQMDADGAVGAPLVRRNLARDTRILHDRLAVAFQTYLKAGMRRAHGLLGIAAQIWENPHSGPAAVEAIDILYKAWRGPAEPFLRFDLQIDPEEYDIGDLQTEEEAWRLLRRGS